MMKDDSYSEMSADNDEYAWLNDIVHRREALMQNIENVGCFTGDFLDESEFFILLC